MFEKVNISPGQWITNRTDPEKALCCSFYTISAFLQTNYS